MKVAIVGMGVIGKRLATAVDRQPDMTLAGVGVRSVGGGVLAHPGLPYFVTDARANGPLRDAGIEPAGDFDALLAAADVVVDAGPARSGAERHDRYRRAGVRSVFCGGEVSRALGPLIHSGLNLATAAGAHSVRLTSCNTTALGRLLAAAGPDRLDRVDATVLRCATDTDKAAKGITNGTTFDVRASHHGTDLEAMMTGARVRVRAAGIPSTCGHVMLVQVRPRRPVAAAMARRIGRARRLTVLAGDRRHDTAAIKARAYRTTHRGDRYVVAVQLEVDDPGTVTAWISLDNEAVTIPETLDVVRVCVGAHEPARARAITDASLFPADADAIDLKEEGLA